MASGIDKLAKQIASIIKKDEQTKGYDTTATVTRIDGGTAWVHIPGGVDETPVKMTVNAKAGDSVQVRVSGGRAFLVGNGTAPPTDDSGARALHKLSSRAIKAVYGVADKAFRIAGNTAQYFWVAEEGTDTGAHITEKPQEEFLSDPDNGGPNLLLRNIGIAIRHGLDELASFSLAGLHVSTYDTNGNEVTVAHLGYGSGKAWDGSTENAPYYDLGRRASGSVIGNYSVVEGGNCTASGHSAHAEGGANTASGNASHAEGNATTASGMVAHAEGFTTTASGTQSHAEGSFTTASGTNSHAGGQGTIAAGDSQTAVGKFNVEDPNNQYAFIVGKGYSANNRSNAFTIDWLGNATVENYMFSKAYDGQSRIPIGAVYTEGEKISHMSTGDNFLWIYGQWRSTGGTYSGKSIITSSSDARLKKNVEDCTVDALELVKRIRMREFDWLHTDEHQKIGFIADELEKLDPKLAVGGGYTKEGMMDVKSVDTFYLLGYLVKAVQELSDEVDRLKGVRK